MTGAGTTGLVGGVATFNRKADNTEQWLAKRSTSREMYTAPTAVIISHGAERRVASFHVASNTGTAAHIAVERGFIVGLIALVDDALVGNRSSRSTSGATRRCHRAPASKMKGEEYCSR